MMSNVEQIDRNVTFVLRLRDDFSKEWGLIGKTRVSVVESAVEALEKAGGYHVFADLSGTEFTVRIENQYYFDHQETVNITDLDPRNPVVNVTMIPKSLYPFPTASTLIRGVVVDPDSNPLEGATVTVVDSSIANKSEEDGRFVLYFGPFTEDDIVVTGGHRYVKVGAGTTLEISIEHPSYTPKTVPIGTVEESKTKLLTTLIRGIVVDPDGNPVEGAVVTVVGSSIANKSEKDGCFVLYFGPFTEYDIVVTGGHRYVKVGAGTTLEIRIERPLYETKTVSIGTVEESTTKLLTTPITLSLFRSGR